MNTVAKLSRAEFARAIKLGHGRALLHVKEHGDSGIEKELRKTLLKNQVYDEQCEGSRSPWLWRILYLTGNLEHYAKVLSKKLATAKWNDRDVAQHYELAALFFKAGFAEFRNLLFASSERATTSSCLFTKYAISLIDVAGLEGLTHAIRVAETNPAVLQAYDCNDVVDHAIDLHYKTEVLDLLKKLGETYKAAQFYLISWNDFNDDDSDRPRSKRERPDFQKILLMIESGEETEYGFSYKSFGKRATAYELEQVLQLLKETSNEVKRLSYLRIFSWCGLPSSDPFVLGLLYSKGKCTAREAAKALSFVSSKQIRAEALKLLKSKNASKILLGSELLNKSYKPADRKVLFKSVQRLKNPDDIHSFGLDMKSLAKESGAGAELSKLFIWLYENGPDSFCRSGFLEKLLEWEKCPAEILWESQWDFGEDVQTTAINALSFTPKLIEACRSG
jgi:hypothetical protein